jgi:hypothetical protein
MTPSWKLARQGKPSRGRYRARLEWVRIEPIEVEPSIPLLDRPAIPSSPVIW